MKKDTMLLAGLGLGGAVAVYLLFFRDKKKAAPSPYQFAPQPSAPAKTPAKKPSGGGAYTAKPACKPEPGQTFPPCSCAPAGTPCVGERPVKDTIPLDVGIALPEKKYEDKSAFEPLSVNGYGWY